uniref:Insulin-like 3 n=1 Tax=Poecilia mexicana TaxID=48701 RepID=A0A3B3WES1_9TELE
MLCELTTAESSDCPVSNRAGSESCLWQHELILQIKMCGRELIRLAVSSCGNSRLRRSILDSELSQQQLAAGCKFSPSKRDQDASTEEDQASETLQIPSSSLAPHWHPLTFRIRRSAGKISDICCEKGCSMKELIQFC